MPAAHRYPTLLVTALFIQVAASEKLATGRFVWSDVKRDVRQ